MSTGLLLWMEFCWPSKVMTRTMAPMESAQGLKTFYLQLAQAFMLMSIPTSQEKLLIMLGKFFHRLGISHTYNYCFN